MPYKVTRRQLNGRLSEKVVLQRAVVTEDEIRGALVSFASNEANINKYAESISFDRTSLPLRATVMGVLRGRRHRSLVEFVADEVE